MTNEKDKTMGPLYGVSYIACKGKHNERLAVYMIDYGIPDLRSYTEAIKLRNKINQIEKESLGYPAATAKVITEKSAWQLAKKEVLRHAMPHVTYEEVLDIVLRRRKDYNFRQATKLARKAM